jgi:hypothetical protein
MKQLAIAYVFALIASTATQAQVIMHDQYGYPYVGSNVTSGGIVTGADPYTGMPVTGYRTPGGVVTGVTPSYPESDPSMFGQVRPDGSIIGLDR